ncbi:MAG: hypothetical protein K6E75_09415 [Lachnospiraceae bacterium]|nr:hypothetical protein [Lachnospiraceae bacterium]
MYLNEEKVFDRLYDEVKNEYINTISAKIHGYLVEVYVAAFSTGKDLMDLLLPRIIRPNRNNDRKWKPVCDPRKVLAALTDDQIEELAVFAGLSRNELIREVRNRTGEYKDDPHKFKSAETLNKDGIEVKLRQMTDVEDSDLSRKCFSLLDLSEIFKIYCIFSGDNSEKALCEQSTNRLSDICPGLKNISVEEWSRLCHKATGIRNKYLGHKNMETLILISTVNDLREIVEPWIRIAKLLQTGENNADYEEIEKYYRTEAERLTWPAVNLDVYVNDKKLGYSKDIIEKIFLEEYRISCLSGYALLPSEADGFEKLGSYRSRHVQMSVERLCSQVGLDEETVLLILAQKGISVREGIIKGHDEQLLIPIFDAYKKEKQLQELRSILGPNATQIQIEQAYRTKIRESTPKLSLLTQYEKGYLMREQLSELCRTHRIMLDPGVLCEKSGRNYVINKLIPVINDLRKEKTGISIYIESTARYHLFQKVTEYEEVSRELLDSYNISVLVNESVQRGLQEKKDSLRKYKTAYLFMQDKLHKELHLLQFTGAPLPLCTDEEAALEYFEKNKEMRICLITIGKTRLPGMFKKENLPGCVIARIENEYRAKNDISEELRIFPNYLPLMEALTDETETDETGDARVRYETEKKERKNKNTTQNESEKSKNPDACSMIPFDEEKIVVSKAAGTGSVLKTENCIKIVLREELLEAAKNAEGGEGRLYVTDRKDVAKIYHTKEDNYRLKKGIREKLSFMIRHNPGITNVMWPKHLLYDNEGIFVGYLMPKVPEGAMTFSHSVLQIGNPDLAKKVLPGWDRSDLIKVCISSLYLLSKLHENGILMGDINPGNFMVHPKESSKVWLVDCDSYQTGGYVCPVGTKDFTHPDTAGRLGIKGDIRFDRMLRTEEEEDYVIAILLFKILFMNAHPFDVKGDIKRHEAMRRKLFPFLNENMKYLPEGNNWMIWKNMPKGVKDLFIQVFTKWEHVTAFQWYKELKNYLWLVENERYTNELNPTKYHTSDKSSEFFTDVICDICGSEYNEYVNNTKKKHGLLLCPACRSVKRIFSAEKEKRFCKCCGEKTEGTKWDSFLETEGKTDKISWKVLFCDNCRSKEKLPICCGKCKKTVYIYKWEFTRWLGENNEFVCFRCK